MLICFCALNHPWTMTASSLGMQPPCCTVSLTRRKCISLLIAHHRCRFNGCHGYLLVQIMFMIWVPLDTRLPYTGPACYHAFQTLEMIIRVEKSVAKPIARASHKVMTAQLSPSHFEVSSVGMGACTYLSFMGQCKLRSVSSGLLPVSIDQ